MAKVEKGEATRASKGRRALVWGIVVLATVIGLATSLTVWAKRQALDTNAVTNASTQILEDDAVRSKLSIYLVDQLYNNENVAQTLSAKLPKQLQPLAAPLAGAIEQLAVQSANTLLERPRVQALFATAVRNAHAAFMRLVNGNTKNLTADNGNVYLDLRPVLEKLAAQYGVLNKVLDKLPPDAGRIELMKKNQLDAIQTGASTINSLSVLLVIAVFGLYAIAIFLARGFRRADAPQRRRGVDHRRGPAARRAARGREHDHRHPRHRRRQPYGGPPHLVDRHEPALRPRVGLDRLRPRRLRRCDPGRPDAPGGLGASNAGAGVP